MKLFVTRKRTVRVIIGTIALLLGTLYIGFPAVMAVGVILPTGADAGNPPAGFTEVTLTTRDNVRLAAWYAEPENGSVIIVLHGAGSGRQNVRDHAVMLHDHGFGVLAVNLRGHGDSEGQTNRLGWNGTSDISAAVDFLTARDEIELIGGLGLSMGGEVLLGAASEYPMMEAVVVEGATYRSVGEYTSLPSNRPFHRNMTHRIFSFMVRTFSGDTPPATTIMDSLEATTDTEFLFIVAGNENEEIVYNKMFQTAVDDRGDLWIVPDSGHIQGLFRERGDYERRIVTFFTTSFERD